MNKSTYKVSHTLLVLLLSISGGANLFFMTGDVFSSLSVFTLVGFFIIYLLSAVLLLWFAKRHTCINGGISSGFLALTALLAGFNTLGLYVDFLKTAVNPKANAYVAAALLLGCVLYSAFSGAEGLTRSTVIFVFFAAVTLIMLFIGALPFFEAANFDCAVKSSFDPCHLLFLASGSVQLVPLYAVLSRSSDKPNGKSAALITSVTAVIAILVILLAVSCFGCYSAIEAFPLFSVFRYAAFPLLEALSGMGFMLITILTLLQLCSLLYFQERLYPQSNRVKLYMLGALFIIFVFFWDRAEVYKGLNVILPLMWLVSLIICAVNSKKGE